MNTVATQPVEHPVRAAKHVGPVPVDQAGGDNRLPRPESVEIDLGTCYADIVGHHRELARERRRGDLLAAQLDAELARPFTFLERIAGRLDTVAIAGGLKGSRVHPGEDGLPSLWLASFNSFFRSLASPTAAMARAAFPVGPVGKVGRRDPAARPERRVGRKLGGAHLAVAPER